MKNKSSRTTKKQTRKASSTVKTGASRVISVAEVAGRTLGRAVGATVTAAEAITNRTRNAMTPGKKGQSRVKTRRSMRAKRPR
jgi:hypothetical protein